MKKFDLKLLLASTGIALGLVIMVMGLRTGLTGRDASGLPDAIENISPGNNERVLRQSQIIVDFIEGYQATMYIDDIELPTTRLDELTSNGVQPKPGAQIDCRRIPFAYRLVGVKLPAVSTRLLFAIND